MLAKRLGAKTVMALINRAAYVDLVQRDIIDIAISPQQATIGSLLAHVRRGDVVKVHALRTRRGRGDRGDRARRPQFEPGRGTHVSTISNCRPVRPSARWFAART